MKSRASDFDYSPKTVPEGALFVAADEPLLVFPSVAAAEQFLEAEDVKNGVYPAAYGPAGEPYSVGSEGKNVVIQRTGEPKRPDEFKVLLLQYLESSDHIADAEVSVDQLVAEVWTIESEFWQEHDLYGDRFGTSIPWWGCAAFVLTIGVVIYAVIR